MSRDQTLINLLYIQVSLGLLTYALAEQNLPMAVVVGPLCLASWLMVEGPNGRPLPRWVINFGALGGVIWFVLSWAGIHGILVVALSRLILCIQVLMLFDRKTNRDCRTLIVLSLMQVVCASIISADIAYGFLLLVYMGVALLVVLKFQIKTAADEVTDVAVAQTPEDREPIVTRLEYTPAFNRHFKRITAACGAACLLLSTLFFVGMPRDVGRGILGSWALPQEEIETGYTTEVHLTADTTVTESETPVLHVRVQENDRVIGADGFSFLLRGSVLDDYNPNNQTWERGYPRARSLIRRYEIGIARETSLVRDPPRLPRLIQRITYVAPHGRTMFSAYAPVHLSFSINAPGRVSLHPFTQVLRSDNENELLEYTVESIQRPPYALVRQYSEEGQITYEQFSEYARGPIFDGEEAQAVFELTNEILTRNELNRDPSLETHPDDGRIAATVEQYLHRGDFQYSLVLPPITAGKDPIISFLFDTKEGHCQYFASAMAAMLRSIGMRCRIVTGYRVTEYNDLGGYYLVRQKHAHAWVETWIENEGWRTYDPSPPDDIERRHTAKGFFASLRDIWEFLEFQWVNKIITFDEVQRQSLITRIKEGFGEAIDKARLAVSAAMERLRVLRHSMDPATLRRYAAIGIAVLVVFFAMFAGARYVARQHADDYADLRGVSGKRRRQLMRQLAFYRQMMRLIESAGFAKPDWQTPAAFASHLISVNQQRFEPVVPLTNVFYEIRFGGRPLDEQRSALIEANLQRLRQTV